MALSVEQQKAVALAKARKRKAEAQQAQPVEQADPTSFGQGVLNFAAEGASAINRGVTGLLDIVPNAALAAVGSDVRNPFTQALSPATQGGFMEPGLARDVVRTGGEFVAPGVAGGAALKAAGKLLPAQLAGESAALGAARSVATGAPVATEAGLSAASGAGTELGEQIGGTPGAIIGGVALPVAAAGLAALAPRVRGNIRIIDNDGLPTPEFDKALTKKGLELGDILDDVDSLPRLIPAKSAGELVDNIVKEKIKTGSGNKFLSKIRLDRNKVVKDELGVEAVRQGFREGDVAAAKGANEETRRAMRQMLGMQRQILKDSKAVQDFRPTDITGRQVLNRFNFVKDKASELSKQLNKIAEGAPVFDERALPGPGVGAPGLKGVKINTAAIEKNVMENLNSLNIQIPDEVLANTTQLQSFLKDKSVFVGSDIAKDKTSQRFIRDVIDLLSEEGSDALKAHRLKRQIDALIDFQKKSPIGLTEKGRSFAKSVRFSLNSAIRDVSPAYARVNDQLSTALDAMNEFQRALGPSIDIAKQGAEKAVGTDLRGLLSNRKTRIKLENSINNLDGAAKALGAEFKVNIKDLNQFANTLDDKFGATARTSLKGEVESVGRRLSQGKSGAVDIVIGEAAKKAEQLRGINEKNALDTMQKLLKRGK